jgi:ADP-ribosylation factor GTPase-activating protein 1
MDAFKASEIERMRQGGNARWREFFDGHADNVAMGIGFEDATIAERYSGEVGDEWKERLSAKVEGREYVAGEKKTTTTTTAASAPTPPMGRKSATHTPTPTGVAALDSKREASPAPGSGKVKVDDRYFARLGADNASRPDDVPPNQGGKYAGFGNMPAPVPKDESVPTLDDLQRDPVAALTKGFGWFTSTVTKTAKTVNDGYIQPTAAKVTIVLL